MSEPPDQRDTAVPAAAAGQGDSPVRAGVYGVALAAGVLLVIVGHTTPVEASGFVTPFLVFFERRRM
ncbi:hypothetical protein [Streptomyces sp. CB01881]|uniref:hypothetical protein n=1 Tax=Streptomyces sp. CB01881 TaxID=2078691 RepID=UPI000CDCB2AE|nr:hypothetical protein [Streptomyces sp. CB01881]AUY49245.1 hypothetical protein C2142_10150 [Streptomyces sp. CB01881]TYC72637.1 hypothetical protein EH183_10160 [Streptomyces sp. CB01881]